MAVTTSQIRDLLNRPRGLTEGTITEYLTIRTAEVNKKSRQSGYVGVTTNAPTDALKESAIKMLIHDTWGFYKDGGKSGPGSYAHPEHMHIEVKDKGGFIGKGLFKNMGGVEFVLDHDTTKALEKKLPGFLNAINKADGKSVMDVLGKYASYDMPEVIPVPIPQPIQNTVGNAYEKAKTVTNTIIAKGKEAFSDILYMR